jgi:hypothetical protein
VPDLKVRRVRPQMIQTEPLAQPLPTADADSFRYFRRSTPPS